MSVDDGETSQPRRLIVNNEPKKYIIVDHENGETRINQTKEEVLKYLPNGSDGCDVFEQGRKVEIKVTLE